MTREQQKTLITLYFAMQGHFQSSDNSEKLMAILTHDLDGNLRSVFKELEEDLEKDPNLYEELKKEIQLELLGGMETEGAIQ